MIKVLSFLLGLSVPVSLQVGTGLPAGIGSLILVVEVFWLIYFMLNISATRRFLHSFNAFTLVAFLWLLTSFLFSPSVSQTLPALKSLISTFTAGVLFAHLIFQQRAKTSLLWGYIVGCTVSSVVAVGFSVAGFDRGAGDYSHATSINALSILIGLGIILSITLDTFRSYPWLMLPTIAIQLMGLIALESRGAIIATILSLLYVSLVDHGKPRLFAVTILTLMGGAVLSSLFLSEVDFLDRLGDLQDVSRTTIWEAALSLPFQQYLFGGGIGSSPYFTGLTLGREWSTHNVWIQILLELGIFGVCACIIFFYKSVRSLATVAGWKLPLYGCGLLLFTSTLSLHFLDSPIFWCLLLIGNNRKLERYCKLKQS